MNIFILNTGRSGSTTIIKACKHISNFTSAHESRSSLIGDDHFDYPNNHIEADNRLSWFLGRLDRSYGENALYVHLKRDLKETAISYSKRIVPGAIIPAYRKGILINLPSYTDDVEVALDYCDTVTSNIDFFLKNKSQKIEFNIENAKEDFNKFWEFIGAEGDKEAALREFDTFHNATKSKDNQSKKILLLKVIRKITRLITKFPDFIISA